MGVPLKNKKLYNIKATSIITGANSIPVRSSAPYFSYSGAADDLCSRLLPHFNDALRIGR